MYPVASCVYQSCNKILSYYVIHWINDYHVLVLPYQSQLNLQTTTVAGNTEQNGLLELEMA